MAKASYLARLPRIAQRRGHKSKGEIEIVTKKKKAQRIGAENAAELKGSALGKGGKRIGILVEDEMHMIVRDPVEYPSGATADEGRNDLSGDGADVEHSRRVLGGAGQRTERGRGRADGSIWTDSEVDFERGCRPDREW